MKNTKIYIAFLILGMIGFAFGLHVYSFFVGIELFHYTLILFVAIAVLISVLLGMRRLRDEKLGLPPKDELSKKIKTKAASKAFTYSFYGWLFILIFTMNTNLNIEVPLGMGILLMGILFAMFWAHYSSIGIDNANSH